MNFNKLSNRINFLEKLAVMGPKHYWGGRRVLASFYRGLGIKGRNAAERLESIKKLLMKPPSPVLGAPERLFLRRTLPEIKPEHLADIERTLVRTGALKDIASSYGGYRTVEELGKGIRKYMRTLDKMAEKRVDKAAEILLGAHLLGQRRAMHIATTAGVRAISQLKPSTYNLPFKIIEKLEPGLAPDIARARRML
ncbi:MAG: hypothetical protein DRO67_07690, partial [Candidatus Asgardarchaeum californiense]